MFITRHGTSSNFSGLTKRTQKGSTLKAFQIEVQCGKVTSYWSQKGGYIAPHRKSERREEKAQAAENCRYLLACDFFGASTSLPLPFLCVHQVHIQMCHSVCVEVISLLPLCGFLESNLVCKALWQSPFPC